MRTNLYQWIILSLIAGFCLGIAYQRLVEPPYWAICQDMFQHWAC